VARLFLAVWLAAFAVQTTDVLMAVAPDSCTEDVEGTAADPCPEGCPRCVCCARVPAFVPQDAGAVPIEPVGLNAARPPLEPSTTPSPRVIYHVPKHA
jgi:hypothetical protein